VGDVLEDASLADHRRPPARHRVRHPL